MKNRYIKIILLQIIVLLLLFSSSSFALMEDTTVAYKKWQELSDKERQNYIEPSLYSLKIEDSVKKSVFNQFSRGVGGTGTSSYTLINDIDIKIKDQKNTNECWAFVTTTMLETNMVKTRNKTMILSPRHIDYATSRTFLDGINEKGYNKEIGMGNFYISLSYCTSGQGPVLETDMPFEDNKDKINLSEIQKQPAVKLENYVKFADIYKEYDEDGNVKYTDGGSTEYKQEEVDGVRNLIKEHIMNYGAVSSYMYLDNDILEYINTDTTTNNKIISYYNNDSTKLSNHTISIIGWNDNYSKNNFNSARKPAKDGAYLVLNSSGSTNGVLTLMAVSYEDVWVEYGTFGIISTDDIDYDKIYQHDQYGFNMPLTMNDSGTGKATTTGYIANTFKRKELTDKEEYLNEVSIYIPKTSNVEIYINTQDGDKTKINKVASAGVLSPGYHTVEIATPLKLTGKEFVVAAKLTSNGVVFGTETNTNANGYGTSYWDNATSVEGESFISLDANTWTDLTNVIKGSNICLKAFTTYQEIEDVRVESITLNKTQVEMQEGESITLITTINPSKASNKRVTWTSSNAEVAKINDKGIITALKEGTTTITVITEDGNKTATCSVTVKNKTNTDDDIYYPEDNIPDTDKNVQDSTTAEGSIPQTGEKATKIFVVTILIGIIIFAYIKIKKTKDIR